MYRIKPKLHNKKLKRTRQREQYFILLPDQTCIIGREFEIMKKWRMRFRDKPIQDMFVTKKRMYSGTTSLSKFIDFDPRQPEGFYKGNDLNFTNYSNV